MADAFGDVGDEGGYKVVLTEDGSIPMVELAVNKTYTVVYKPKKDLVTLLSEVREAEAKLNQLN